MFAMNHIKETFRRSPRNSLPRVKRNEVRDSSTIGGLECPYNDKPKFGSWQMVLNDSNNRSRNIGRPMARRDK